MMHLDTQLGKYAVTARLLKLVQDMPENQQVALLKQLLGKDLTNQLFKLIVTLPEDRQLVLLEQMGEFPSAEMPVKTVSLEETGTSMRENPRKPCLINANYRIQGQDFKSYILDISIGGVFIETEDRIPVGRQLMMKFSLPNVEAPFTLSGQVAWNGPQGFGVKFDRITPQQGRLLKSYIEQDK
jgi:Tfp pilus assembly protein PilZ